MSIGDSVLSFFVSCSPLPFSAGAFLKFELVVEQVLEIKHTPLSRLLSPGSFQAAGYRIGSFTGTEAVLPSETLHFDRGFFRIVSQMFFRSRAMHFSECVSAGNECNGFFIIHGHTFKRLPYIFCRFFGIGHSIRPFRVHINQSHVVGSKPSLKITRVIMTLICQPFMFRPPVDVYFRFPYILAAGAKSKCLKTHRLKGHITGKNHQVSPGNFSAIFLLYRPKQTSCLVKAHVIRPAVEGSISLVSCASAAATIGHTVDSGTVPCHTDKQGTIMTPVGRPPVLRVGHQVLKIRLHLFEIE